MKTRPVAPALWLILSFFLLAAPASAETTALYLLKTRVRVAPLPHAKLVEIWVPLPPDGPFQKIEGLTVTAPWSFQVTREPKYGNRFLYLRREGPLSQGAEIRITAKVRREEASPRSWQGLLPLRLLLSDRLVPVEDFRDMALELTRGKRTSLEKLRALYDYVVENLRYDKSGQGWGRGDALWACSHKHGNCTDFHSLLVAMARAVGIPVLFEMGLPVPPGGGAVKGYHCWLLAFPGGQIYGLDASEAAKHPAKRNYFFGHLCEGRILLTKGRDLLLSPAQHGPRLNLLYQAYLEVDLKPAPKKIETQYYIKIVNLHAPARYKQRHENTECRGGLYALPYRAGINPTPTMTTWAHERFRIVICFLSSVIAGLGVLRGK